MYGRHRHRLKLLLTVASGKQKVLPRTRLQAFRSAEAGVYGSEFDVQLTADGVVVVNHDDVVEGLVIGETRYEKLKDIKLKNGERIPLLEEYLKTGKQLPEIRLVLEIKPHKTQSQENQIAAACVRLVKNMEWKSRWNIFLSA